MKSPMNDETAARHSRDAVDTGYSEWLVDHINKAAHDQFVRSTFSDVEGLQRARVMADVAMMLSAMIESNANGR